MKILTPENSLQAICQKYNVSWQWDSISQVFSFSPQGKPAKVLVGSNLVIVDGRRVILSVPVERKNNAIIVPPDFIEKVFGTPSPVPVVVPAIATATGRCREIMIDAGHGGKDPGAQGRSKIVEKDIVLDVARRLKEDLEK